MDKTEFNRYLGLEWIPKLMQSDDPQHTAFLDEKGELHYVVLDHDEETTDVSTGVIYAYQISLLLGCTNRKSIRNLLRQHKELPFTIDDWDEDYTKIRTSVQLFSYKKEENESKQSQHLQTRRTYIYRSKTVWI